MPEHGEIICHSRQHFEAAFATIRQLKPAIAPIIRTAPDAAAYAGALYLRAAASHSQKSPAEMELVVLDCGDDPSLVLGALRVGWSAFAFTGSPIVHDKVSELIARWGAHLVQINQGPVLDLHATADPIRRCQTWLSSLDQGTTSGQRYAAQQG